MSTNNAGEEMVSNYLEYVKGCDFVNTNIPTLTQGEMDVLGIDLNTKEIYVCEVATHLSTGLQYGNNVNKIVAKFTRDIEYINEKYSDYKCHFMLWSPIVKSAGSKAKNNQLKDVNEIVRIIKNKYDIEIEIIINRDFLNCINELRKYAKNETKALVSPVMRAYQIEEAIIKYINTKHRY